MTIAFGIGWVFGIGIAAIVMEVENRRLRKRLELMDYVERENRQLSELLAFYESERTRGS